MVSKLSLSFPDDLVIPLKIVEWPGIKEVREHIIIDIANDQITDIKYNGNNSTNENISIRINDRTPNNNNNNANNQKTSSQYDFGIDLQC